jgi:hypothetical protein
MKHTSKIANSSAAPTASTHGAAPPSTALDALFGTGVSRSHADSCDDNEMERLLTDLVDVAFPSSPRWIPSCACESYNDLSSAASTQMPPTTDERSATTEPLTFDSFFNATSQSTGTAPPTPYVHDASAFTTMHNSLPPTTIFPDLATKFDFDASADQAAFAAAVQTTPPSASEPPALSFSPTSPFDAMLSATPGTGLSLMDVDSLDADFEGMPLFFEDGFTLPLFPTEDSSVSPSALGLKGIAAPPPPSGTIEVATAPVAQPTNELDGLIAMSGTPNVLPVPLSTAFLTAPLPSTSAVPGDTSSTATPATPVAAPKSVNRPTGHRKNLTPSALLPVDAPTQPRSYRGPSATSRKDIPAFALASSSRRANAAASKKRKAEDDLEDLEGDDDEEEMATGKIKPRMGESEIEAKRRQNTLAARRSRHRKLQYVRELEDKVLALMRQNEEMAERLRNAGLEA